MVHIGMTTGTSSNTFSPNNSITRAQTATFLYRLGLPTSTSETMPSDVSTGSFYYDSIKSVLGLGIMKTNSENLFCPHDLAYPSEIDMQAFYSVFFATTTSPVQLDLSQGSIEIAKNIIGNTVITQGDINICTEDTSLLIRQSGAQTANTISVNSGNITITLAGVNIGADSSAISVNNNASLTLNLVGENTANGGILVPEDASLTIQGTGELTTIGVADYAAGIGGSDGNGGDIIINSGTVTATGGHMSAGIGGGDYNGNGGTIIINGGTVTATGGSYGAGIGGAIWGSGGTITINGGTVTAIGGYGAGIGGCGNGGIWGNGGDITISRGNVTAHGYYNAIGGGNSENTYGCNSLTIGENAILTLSHRRDDGYDCQERIFDLELPAAVAALANNTLDLSTEARSHSGITDYQWQISPSSSDSNDWTDIDGQTSAAYTAPMTAEQNGQYFRCKITNVYGNVAYTDVSQGFVLAFKNQPQSVETGLNQTAALNATSICPNVTYQWQRSYDDGATWSNVPGENYATLLVSTTRSENGALYRCIITASNGDELASENARITVETGEQTYTVRYYQENPDGSGYTVVSQDVLTGEAGQTVIAPEKTFEGFTENTTKGTTSGTVTGSSLILSRYFDRNIYQITFDMGGGPVIASLSARYGALVQAPNTPNRYGYMFGGWYADASLMQTFEFTTMPLNGVTVYAKWITKGQNRGIEYRIEELTFRNIDTYETLDSILSGDFLAEVTVTNLSSTETDTVLLITYDKSGRMLDMSYLYANPQIGQTITLGTKIQNSKGQVGKVKALVLPNLADPTPLANAVEKT